MEQILLFLDDPEARKLLPGLRAGDFQAAAADSAAALAQPCDLAIVDLPRLGRMRGPLRARKKVEEPVLFPVLLAILPQELEQVSSELGLTADEIILLPVEPQELRLRVGNLLRARRLSRELQARQREVEAGKAVKERFQALFEFSPLAVMSLDPNGLVTGWNPAAERLFGWRADEVLGRPLPTVPEEYQEELADLIRREQAGERVAGVEVHRVRRDGTPIRVKLDSALIRDAGGNITGFLGILEDITDQKRTEEEIKRLASFPQLNPNPVLEVDLSGRITFSNEATAEAVEKLGLSEIAEFLPSDLTEIITAASQDEESRFYREKRSAKASFGQIIHYVKPFNVLRIYTFDITARREAEEAERRAREDWERTFDAVPDLIAILDQEHRVVRGNRAMAAALGLEPGQLVGRPCYKVVHGMTEPPPFCPHTQLLKDGQAHTAEVHELDRHFLVTASPLTDEQGRTVGSVHVARDITERKQAEEAVRRQAELLDLANDAILVWDLKNRIVFWNRGAAEFYGWTKEEVLAQDTHQLLKTEFPQPLNEMEEELLKTGRWEGELIHYARDGRRLVVAARWALHRDEPGKPARVLQICTDITARKQAEEALKRAHAELELRVEERTADLKAAVEQLQEEVTERQRAEKQAESIGRLYRLLSQVNEAIVRAPDQDTLFKQICRIAVEEGLFRMAWVGLTDPSGRKVRSVAQYGFDEGYLETLVIPLEDVPESRGPTGIAVREGRFDVCNDFASDPPHGPLAGTGSGPGLSLLRGLSSAGGSQGGRSPDPLRREAGVLQRRGNRPAGVPDRRPVLRHGIHGSKSQAPAGGGGAGQACGAGARPLQ